MSQKCFDVMVVGLGTMGTFACLEIARRKASVVGFDRFAPPHNQGSHSGDTRVFREAYGEFPSYVPLARRAGELWDRLGEEAAKIFLHRCGMLNIGREDSSLISGIRESAALHELHVEQLSAAEISSRFPAFAATADSTGIFEPSAGWLDVGSSLEFGLNRAAADGADIRLDMPVEGWEFDGTRFRVRTSEGTILAERLVITAGAWSGRLLADLRIPLKVLRKVLIWVDPLNPELFLPGRFPIFSFSDRFLYGFPNIGGRGVKFAIHWDPTATVTEAGATQALAERSEVEPALAIATELMPLLAGSLPAAFDRVVNTRTCLYTMTPDEGFIVDRHPHLENAYIGTGFSGHGFKFAPVIGEALADLALSGTTSLPIGPLAISKRFAL